MCLTVSTLRCRHTSKRVAHDDADAVAAVVRVADECVNLLTYEHIHVAWLLDFRASESHSACEIDLTSVEESAEEQDCSRVNCPYHFAFVDRIDVIYLYADVSSRAFSSESDYFHIGSIDTLRLTDAEVCLRNLAESSQTGLEILLLTLEFKLEIAS